MAIEPVKVHLESSQFSCEHIQIQRLAGREAISQLFRLDVTIVVNEPGEIDPETVLGAEVTVVFTSVGVEVRRIHGMVAAIDDLLDGLAHYRSYRLTIRPRANRLSLVETQDVFLSMSVPAIVEQKLALLGLGPNDVEMRLTGTYPERELVVEYKESDLAFVSRLTEHLGISFFFEEHDGRDKLVFTDNQAGFRPIGRDDTIRFNPRGERGIHGVHEGRGVHGLEHRRSVMPETWMVMDYNYRIPRVDLTASHQVPGAYPGGVVEYGAHHKTPEQGEHLARVRAEERAAQCRFYVGESEVCEFAAGATFRLEGHPQSEHDRPMLLVEVEHDLVQVVDGFGGNDANAYKNRFRAVDGEPSYRPPRVTPRPKIHGVVTALVEPRHDGSIGQVADLDAQGRYTVRFYFDTSSPGERPKSTHHVRMIQQHSGPNYGTHLPLKAGIEVLMVFIDGDPDRPLIVGSVHNPVTPSPVTDVDPHKHRVKTASGIIVEMRDSFRRST